MISQIASQETLQETLQEGQLHFKIIHYLNI